MSLLSALNEQELKPDHGWSNANMFSQDMASSQSGPTTEITNIPEVIVNTSDAAATTPIQTSKFRSSHVQSEKVENISRNDLTFTSVNSATTSGTIIQQETTPNVVSSGGQQTLLIIKNVPVRQTTPSVVSYHTKPENNSSQSRGHIYDLLKKSQTNVVTYNSQQAPVVFGIQQTAPVSNPTSQAIQLPLVPPPGGNTQVKGVLVSSATNNTITVDSNLFAANCIQSSSQTLPKSNRVKLPVTKPKRGVGTPTKTSNPLYAVVYKSSSLPGALNVKQNSTSQLREIRPNVCPDNTGVSHQSPNNCHSLKTSVYAIKCGVQQPVTDSSQTSEKVFAKYNSCQQASPVAKANIISSSISLPQQAKTLQTSEASPQMLDHGYASLNSGVMRENLESSVLIEGSNSNVCEKSLKPESSQKTGSVTLISQEVISSQPSQHQIVLSTSSINNTALCQNNVGSSIPVNGTSTLMPVKANIVQEETNIPSSINVEDVRVLGNQNLQKNTVYMIHKSKNHPLTTMMYDGKSLKPCQTQHTLNDSPKIGLSGGGLGERKEKPLRGNATGLNMTGSRGTLNLKTINTNTRESPPENKILQNGRFWKHSGGPQNNLTRKPLHEQQGPNTDKSIEKTDGTSNPEVGSSGSSVQIGPSSSHESSSNSNSNVTEGRKRCSEVMEEEHVVHCRFCGYSSSDIKQCERCGRTFPNNVKIIFMKRAKTTQVKHSDGSSDSAISKQSFYGKNTNDASPGQAFMNYIKQRGGRRTTAQGRSYRMSSLTQVKPRRVIPEPVTIHISSDEDEPETDKLPDIAPSMNLGTQESQTVVANSIDDPDDLSQLVNVLPVKRPTSPTFTTSRVGRMENQSGELVKSKKLATDNIKSLTTPNSEDSNESSNGAISQSPSRLETDESFVSSITMKARRVSIGSLTGIPVEPIVVTKDGIHFYIEGEESSYRIHLNPSDLQQCLFCLNEIYVIFLHVTDTCGERLCNQIKMENTAEMYFDPGGAVMKHQFITIILTSTAGVTDTKLSNLLGTFMGPRNPKKDFIYQMNAEEAHHYMTEVCPDGLADVEKFMKAKVSNQSEEITLASQGPAESERSPSPPRILFSGPVIKLITFPPPPTKGGIQVTNEDLFCLQEGEFLNDVIIDFYLKYIFYRKLSETDRNRTHVFSSFFFKRLTQRANRGSMAGIEKPDMTPAEKKHARVKTWTKHVDLFEKDFIIVPINEHSHWFLAIICFPGLPCLKSVNYIPKCSPIPVKKSSALPSKIAEQPFEGNKLSKSYKIPKLGQKGSFQEDNQNMQTECSEETTGESTEKTQSESQIVSDCTQESMETNEETLSAAQAAELGEQEEVVMETDESEKQQQNISIRYLGKDCRGRELTAQEEKDPEILKRCLIGQQQPCILVLDSLAGQSRNRIISILKEYLQVEWDVKKKTKNSIKDRIRGSIPKVPQQTNFSDCGVYVLQYVDSFFEDPIQDFSIPLKSLTNWFSGEEVNSKREQIRELVMQLKEEQEQTLKS